MKKLLFLFLLMISYVSYAQNAVFTSTLVCTGMFDDKPISFDLIVNVDTGEMWQFPRYLALGCAEIKEDDLKKSFSIDEDTSNMKCSNGIISSDLSISRNTGTLTIINLSRKSKNQNEQPIYLRTLFTCKQLTKKIF